MYLFLLAFWFLLNGKFTIELCIFGIALTAAMAVLMYALFQYTPKTEVKVLSKVPLFVCYVFVLIWEIVKANIGMTGYILNKNKPADPTLVSFDSGLKTKFVVFILANSITLTPGTITVKTDGSRLTVHCLTRSMLDTSDNGTFIKWIKRLEGTK